MTDSRRLPAAESVFPPDEKKYQWYNYRRQGCENRETPIDYGRVECLFTSLSVWNVVPNLKNWYSEIRISRISSAPIVTAAGWKRKYPVLLQSRTMVLPVRQTAHPAAVEA
jgi:hypothetical protein